MAHSSGRRSCGPPNPLLQVLGRAHAPVTEHEVQPVESVVTEAPAVPEQETGSQERLEAKVEPTEASQTLTSVAPEPHESTPVESTATPDSHDKSPTAEEEWATAKS